MVRRQSAPNCVYSDIPSASPSRRETNENFTLIDLIWMAYWPVRRVFLWLFGRPMVQRLTDPR